MSNNTLPVSRLVAVSVNLSPAAAQGQSLSNCLVLGTSTVIDTVERFRSYSSLAAVAADFGTSAEEYFAAALWFEQAPQPTKIMIGRWVNANSKGGLRCRPLSAAEQVLTNFTAVASGGFTYTKDGGGPTNVTGINLTGAASLNAVAALIQAALVGVAVVWNATLKRFEFTSNTTGATSAVSFLSAPGSGTDISGLLGGRSTDSGAYTFAGQVAESAVTAATLFDNNYGQLWYALVIPSAVDADHQAVGAYIEGTNTKHLYGVTTQSAGVLVAATTTDIAYVLKALGLNKTVVQYSSYSAYAVMSLLGRILTTDYGGNNTTITLMYKQEPGIVAESLTASQADSAAGKNCNVFVNYENGTAIIQNGTCASGEFVDVVTGTDALAVELQRDVFNLLYTSPTKIPQTDPGMHLMATVMEGTCERYRTNGFLAPGVWNSQGFGILSQGDYMPKGYYVYAPKVSSQSSADRAARKSVPFQIAAKLAGAVHTVSIAVTVNQ